MATSHKSVGNSRTIKKTQVSKTVSNRTPKQKLESSLKKMVPESTQKKRARKNDFIKVIDEIVAKIESRVPQSKNQHDLFFANKGSVTKLASTYSLYGEDPEEFTIRYLTEPLLRFLGYDDIAYEAKLGTNGKKADLALILSKDESPNDMPEIIVVEGKSIGIDTTALKVRNQLKKYLSNYNKSSLYTPYMGILTDGMTWELHILKTDGTFGKPFVVNIQPLLRWIYLRRIGQSPPFPQSTYTRFIKVLHRDNIKVYGDCLRYGVEIAIIDEKGKQIPISALPIDEPVEMKEMSVPTNYASPVDLQKNIKTNQ